MQSLPRPAGIGPPLSPATKPTYSFILAEILPPQAPAVSTRAAHANPLLRCRIVGWVQPTAPIRHFTPYPAKPVRHDSRPRSHVRVWSPLDASQPSRGTDHC